MTVSMNSELQEALQEYTSLGWCLIPVHYIQEPYGVCSCGNANCASPGKHPVPADWTSHNAHIHTIEDAMRVWSNVPDGTKPWNVGIITGKCSGIFVVDVDVDGKPGLKSLEEMTWAFQLDRRTRIHQTGSGGYHYFFRLPDGWDITNSNKPLRDDYPGIDIRGNGGFVVAPPSQSAKGDYVVHDASWGISQPNLILLERLSQKFNAHRVDSGREQINHEWNSLPEKIRTLCDAYARKGIENELARFAPGTPEYDHGEWDNLTNEIAHTCLILANSPWNSLQLGFIQREFGMNYTISTTGMVAELFDSAFEGGSSDWDDDRKAKCIHSAFEAVVRENKTRTMPKEAQAKLDEITNAATPKEFDWDSQIMGFEGLADYFTQDYLIEDYLPENVVARLFGSSGSFKSFVVLDMAARISLGMEWYGHYTKKGKVLYIAAEGEQGMYKRALAWNQKNNCQMDVHFLPKRLQVTPGGPEWNSFIQYVAKQQYKMVIFDTQAKTTIGVNEDSATDFGKIVDAWDDLREKTNATVLIIHHTGWSNKERVRGSSASTAGINTELRVERQEETRYLTITSPKQKDDDDQTNVRLLMEQITVKGLYKKSGEPETSLVPTFPFTVRGAKVLKNAILDGKTADYKRDVVDLVAKMDAEKVPLNEGRESIKRRCEEWQIKASNDKLSAAIKIRKEMETQ